jgi:hypothetical protein
MKKRIAVPLSCLFVALAATAGLLAILAQASRAATIPAVERPTTREFRVDSAPADPSSGGFTVTPASLSVTVLPSDTVVRVLTVSRLTDGAPGTCDGHFEISGTHLVRRLYRDTYCKQSQTVYVTSIGLSIVWFVHSSLFYEVGEAVPLHDGETGITDFTSTDDDPEYDVVVSRFTDGINNCTVIAYDLLDEDGLPHGGGSFMKSEGRAFRTDSDLIGHSIDVIRRDVTDLTVQSAGGHWVDYSFDVAWSFWEYSSPGPYWMWAGPAFGDLEVGESQQVSVTFAATELMSGTTALPHGVYSATLLIDPGADCAPPISVPVTMEVREPSFLYLPLVVK